jgi:uncharacterized protein YqeY
MSLIEKILQDSIAARKSGEKLKGLLLTTLYAEAARVGKDAGNRSSTDDEVLKTVKKFQKNADETLKVATGEAKAKVEQELAILAGYLPDEMDETALKNAIAVIVEQLPEKSPKAMGQVMAALKAAHGGAYDGKLASNLVKQALA